MGETSKLCNSFMLVQKANGKVGLCLDLTRFKNILIRPPHRGLTFDDILPMTAGMKYLTLIDVTLGYNSQKLG